MEHILEAHEDMIDKHEDKLERIQTDLTDIKVRLGIKDKTNGQVLQYQQELVGAQQAEIDNRKEADNLIREDIRKLDERLWYVVTGIVIVIAFDILALFIGGIL